MTAGVRKSQELRAAAAARKGGTPGEGSPFAPLLRFFSTRRVPRAAAPVSYTHLDVYKRQEKYSLYRYTPLSERVLFRCVVVTEPPEVRFSRVM